MRKLIILVGILFIVLAFQGCKGNEVVQKNSSTTKYSKTLAGEKKSVYETKKLEKPIAPDIYMWNANGEKIKLSNFKGKVVFLNFWGSWCPPCRDEMPDIDKIYKEYKEKGVQVLAANVQGISREKDVKTVAEWVKQKGYEFPLVFVDIRDASAIYGINAFPTSFFINAKGYIDFYQRGALTEEQMRKILDTILAAQEE